MVGYIEMKRLREKAKTAGRRLRNLRAFNDTIVLGGNVPLDVLAKNVGIPVSLTTRA